MQDRNEISSYFEKVVETNEGFKTDCPRCGREGKMRLYFNTEKNVGCCFTEGCNWGKNRGGVTAWRLRAWFKKEGIVFNYPTKIIEKPKDTNVLLPKEYKVLDELNMPLRDSIFSYLVSRGLMKKTIRDVKVGYCETGKFWGYIVFPVFDMDGNVIYWQGRRYKDREPKFWNPKASNKKEIYYQVGGSTRTTTIILVESIMNALTLSGADKPTGWAAIALLGHSLSEEHREHILCYERSLREIIIALDPDAQGDAPDMARRLVGSGYIVRIAQVPKGEDINSLGRMKAWELLRAAELYNAERNAEAWTPTASKSEFEYKGYARR